MALNLRDQVAALDNNERVRYQRQDDPDGVDHAYPVKLPAAPNRLYLFARSGAPLPNVIAKVKGVDLIVWTSAVPLAVGDWREIPVPWYRFEVVNTAPGTLAIAVFNPNRGSVP